MKRRFNLAKRPYIYGLLTVLLLVTSLSFISRPLFTPKENAAQVSSSDETALTAELDDMVNVQTIRDLASADGTGEPVDRIKLEQQDDQLHYVVALRDGTILAYDAKTGNTISPDGKTVDDVSGEPLPSNFKSVINFSRARAIGLSRIPNGIVKKISYVVEDGVVLYSVRFADGKRVDIDAATGKVVHVNDKKEDSRSEKRERDNRPTQGDERQNQPSERHPPREPQRDPADNRGQNHRDRQGNSDSNSSDSRQLSSFGIRLDTLWR